MAKLGTTYGHVKQNIASNRVYIKPSLQKPVIRFPGVVRRSEKVLAINEKLEALRGKPEHPSTICKGRPWHQFIACTSAEMDKVISPVP